MADQPLNAQQVQAIEDKIRRAIFDAIENMRLRKFAVETALAAKPADVVATAKQIYEFVTLPSAEVVVRLEQ